MDGAYCTIPGSINRETREKLWDYFAMRKEVLGKSAMNAQGR